MSDSLEQNLLAGAEPQIGLSSRSSSPTTSEELELGDSYAFGTDYRDGPQTGVKGVRNDAKVAEQQKSQQRAIDVRQTNARMESKALGTHRTWEQDEIDRRAEMESGLKPGQTYPKSRLTDESDEELADIRRRRLHNYQSQAASNEARRRRMAGEDNTDGPQTLLPQTTGTFGHLREVKADQYVHAVEGEDPSTYVVVHIYVKYVHACAMLTSALSSLARIYSRTKFVQIRAGSIGFGSGSTKASIISTQDDSIDEEDADEVAEDIVPTLLIYKAGKLVANLVRVDLEAAWGDGSESAIRDLLKGNKALQ